MALDNRNEKDFEKGFNLAKQVGGAGAGKQYILKNVDKIAQLGGSYQQPTKKTDPRLGGNMLGGYGSPGVTGAKGTGGGWIGMGSPQQVAAMHANPQLTQQLYGFTPKSVTGSFAGHTAKPSPQQEIANSMRRQAEHYLNPANKGTKYQAAPELQAWAQQYMAGNTSLPMPYRDKKGNWHNTVQVPQQQLGGMQGGQGLAGGGLSGTINQTLQRLLGGGGAPQQQQPRFIGQGTSMPIGTRGAFGAPQQQQQQPGQFPTDALEAQQAGQIAQQLRAEEQAIREDFGRRGQAGSPAMEAALRQARDRASQGRSQGLQQLQVSAYGQNREQREADRNALMRALQLALSATGQSQGLQQQQMANMLNMFGG